MTLREKVPLLEKSIQEKDLVIVALGEEIQKLKEQNEWLKRQMFGAKSERIVDNPDAPFLPGMELIGPAKPEESKLKVETHERKAHRNQTGWQELPADLPREEIVIKVPEAQRLDSAGNELELIGYEITERLAWRSSYIVKVFKREKLASKANALEGVVVAPHPGSVLDSVTGKSKFDISFIAHMIVSKICDYLPLNRQSDMLARVGLNIDRSTLCRIFGASADVLSPLYDRLVELILSCDIIHADKSPINMLSPGNGACKKAWIWCRMSGVGPPLTAFHFATDRTQNTAEKILGDYEGTVIRDAYCGYDSLEAAHAACWAHVRRKFFEAKDNHPEAANKILALIRQLYEFERQAKHKAEPSGTETALFDARRKYRKNSKEISSNIFEFCKKLIENEPPSSQIAKAALYTFKLKSELSLFLNDPRLNIDNNPAENSIRPIALGRKNYLFAGNEEGGRRLAILLSLAATCKANKINVQQYFEDVLQKIHTTPANQIETLLPHLWNKI